MSHTKLIQRYLQASGISFLGMALICVLLYPDVFQHYEYGVSYFGSVGRTAIPYYLGFGLTVTFIVLTAMQLRRSNKVLSVAFWSVAVCMAGVAITSHSINGTIYAIHWVFASLLALCILATAFWLIRNRGLTRLDYALIAIIVATIVISVLPIVHDIPFIKYYIPRELLVFSCSLWLFARAALSSGILKT